MIKIVVVNSKYVCEKALFSAYVGFLAYGLGIQLHEWGVRVIFLCWHFCIRK